MGSTQVQEGPNGSVKIVGPRGVSEVGNPRGNIVSVVQSGHIDAETAEPMLGAFSRFLKQHGRIQIFADTSGMSGYDPAYRATAQDWFAAHRNDVSLHLLIKSKLIAMGAQVMSLALNWEVKTYADKAAFEAAQRAAPQVSRPPAKVG